MLLRTASGRVRLGWRLLTWLVVTAVLGLVVGMILPQGLVGGGIAGLVGAVGGGAAALSVDGRGPGAMGFHLARSVPREAVGGLTLGCILAAGVAALMAVLGGVAWSSDAGTLAGWAGGAVGAAALLALPAAAEEALLRGYPLQALAEAWGPGWALLLTSAFFGFGHLWNPGITPLALVNVAAAGVFLGAVYLRTASLWWATGAHLGWNWGIGYLVGLPVSGIEVLDAPLIEATMTGPGWLGGGAFGPEGSLAATFGFLVAAAVCWWSPLLRPGDEALARRPLAFAGATDNPNGAETASPTDRTST